ncbi:type I-E CRISPR-associated protein Cas7/Cse4/CasC [Brooklawnia cerclae]|uniref:CRISPR system Cascade subunit CasC n=1 Tax=Brooklawnia cerclae TaxID=349934 RepID=A0ABX0SK22_9ACTN|nr:type I-E CRISPR-associated protein Cas7/Cse4/CasC [Brooklawnia cerclae]NIH57668.1 CRISPR system Cascade subunit CasC [Brooklawnia cerclae]
MTTFIDLHILQTVPPSNINRDDTGSPKTAIYGGVRRARVSSQAWKRATRREFSKYLDESELGERTLIAAERIAEVITELKPELRDRSLELATNVLKAVKIKVTIPKVKDGTESAEKAKTGYLLFVSNPQVRALAELAIANLDGSISAKDVKKALTDGVSIDIALFGRMIADAPDLNVDASAQVAHAISVHGVDNEFDYFTAVDDHAPADNAGAGMIGTVEFNSSTLYRYATVNADQLAKVLGSPKAAAAAVEAFVRAFIVSMPTGKQNTFANRTLPDLVALIVRDDQPVNLVGAFEHPIESENRVVDATRALLRRAEEIDIAFSVSPVLRKALAVGEARERVTEAGIELADLDGLVVSARDTVAGLSTVAQ